MSSSEPIAERIIQCIARSPRTNNDLLAEFSLEKAQLDPHLWGPVVAVAERSQDWRWRLREGVKVIPPADTVATRTQRLLRYFTECVALDAEVPSCDGISARQQLRVLSSAAEFNDIPASGAEFLDQRRGARSRTTRLGIGLIGVQVPAARGELHFRCAPLAVSRPLESLSAESISDVLLDGLALNPSSIALLGPPNAFEELIEVALTATERLSLERPWTTESLNELLAALPAALTEAEWLPFPRDGLGAIIERQQERPTAYAVCSIISSDEPRYTAGLLEELKFLAASRTVAGQDSVLRFLMGGASSGGRRPMPQTKPLIEPVPLNEEQRDAVSAALACPLTVIEGPPGTGKSQVVAAILANAAWRGERVLFASRNNAAVNVVAERLNGLAERPSLLRLGGRDLEGELADQLRRLLTGNSPERDRRRCAEKCKSLEDAVEALRILNRDIGLGDTRMIGFERAWLDAQVARKSLTPDQFERSVHVDPDKVVAAAGECKRLYEGADRRRQDWFTRATWPFRRSRRFEQARQARSILEERLGPLDRMPTGLASDEAEVDALVSLCGRYLACGGDLRLARACGLAARQLEKEPRTEEIYSRRRDAIDGLSAASQEAWAAWLAIADTRVAPETRSKLGSLRAMLEQRIEARRTGADSRSTPEWYNALEAATSALPLWAVTSLSIRKRLPLRPGLFDLVVIDEASQCDIASAVPLLYRARRAVIIGDSNQLSHITNLSPAHAARLQERHEFAGDDHAWSYRQASLLDRCVSTHSPEVKRITLCEHFRCHPDIIEFSNREFYDGRLFVRTRIDRLAGSERRRAVEWIDVKGVSRRQAKGSHANPVEAEEVLKLVERLLGEVGASSTLGVCAPFSGQIDYMRQQARKRPALEAAIESGRLIIDTVHRYQGNERDVMVFSPVVALGAAESALRFLARTKNLFNVAITRARAHLIVVGDRAFCEQCEVDYLRRFAEHVRSLEARPPSSPEGTREVQGEGERPGGAWLEDLAERLRRRGCEVDREQVVDRYSVALAVRLGEMRVAVDVDDGHSQRVGDRDARRADIARWERIEEVGWRIVRVTPFELEHRMESCEQRVAGVLKEAQEPLSTRINPEDIPC